MTTTQNSKGAGTPERMFEPVVNGLPRGYSVDIRNTANLFTYSNRAIEVAGEHYQTKHYRTMWNDRIGNECVEFRYLVRRKGVSIGYGYIRHHYVVIDDRPTHPDSMGYGNTLARFYYGLPFSEDFNISTQLGTILEYCSDGFNDSPNVNNPSDTRVVCYDPTLSDEHVKTLRTWKDVRKVLQAMDETLRPYSEQYIRVYRPIGSPWYDELTD